MNNVDAGMIPIKMVSTENMRGYSIGYATSRINKDKLPMTIIRKNVMNRIIILINVVELMCKMEYV
jgi:hypothetical protein